MLQQQLYAGISGMHVPKRPAIAAASALITAQSVEP